MPSIHFTVTAEDKNLQRVLKEIEKGVQGTSDKVKESGDDIDNVFDKITKGAATMAAAFSATQLVKKIADVRGEFQQLEVAFNTMLQSEERANALMSQLTETAAVTPFGLQEVAGSAKQLLAYGVAAEDVNERLVMLGDIAAGLSIPLSDLAYLYGTTMTQGRMYTQDLNQFMGRGIPIADELAKQFGVTKGKVKELVTAGKIGFEEMHKSLVAMTSEGGKFGGLMEAQSKTIKGQISNIEDAIDVMFNQIGQANEGVINSALSFTSVLVENYQKIGAVLEPLVVTYGAYRTALMVASAATKVKTLTTGLATTAEKAHYLALLASEKAQKALNLQMLKNPYGLAAAAVVTLTYALYKYFTRASGASKATQQLNKDLKSINDKHNDQKNKIDKLVDSMGNLEVSETDRISNFAKLKSEYPDILKDINTENEFLKEKARLLKLINDRQMESLKSENQGVLEKYKTQLEQYQVQLNALKAGKGNIAYAEDQFMQAANYTDVANQVEQYEEMIKKLKIQISQIDVDRYKQGISDMTDKDITAMVGRLSTAIGALGDASDDTLKYVTELGGEFSKGQLKDIMTVLQGEQSNRKDLTKKSAASWVAQYKKGYEDAEKAIKAFMQKRDSMSEAEFEKQLKELTDKRDEAKKKYESTDNSVKNDQKQGEEAVKLQREILKQKRQVWQDEINLMKDGPAKAREQLLLNYNRELDAIEQQREDWIREYGKLTQAQEEILKDREVQAGETKSAGLAKIQEDENKRVKEAWNEYLIQYGEYEKKRQALKEKWQKKIDKATSQSEKDLFVAQMTRELAELDDEAVGVTTTITKVFGDMSDKTVSYIKSIIDEAEQMLEYLKGEFQEEGDTGKDRFGLTKELFELYKESPEKLAAIIEQIKNLKKTASDIEPAFDQIKDGLKALFIKDISTSDFNEALEQISNGVGKVTNAVGFLSDSLSMISDAFGGNFLGGIAEGLNIAMDAVNSTMQGAQAGAAFGPWGAAAGAAIGLVSSLTSSLSKLHDKKHEKSIQRIQGEIEDLKDDYDKLGEAIEKAYSSDASNKIKEQNELLERQKDLIEQQIAEEESKKKTDKGRIEEWKAEIDSINKKIEENKEKAIDAIFGEDLQNAINDFAEAYADALSSTEDGWESVRDTVKQMMQNMVKESIKSALQSSDAIKKIREQLLKFYEDSILTQAEQDAIYKMAEDVQKELDKQFGWAENLFKDDTSAEQKATYGGFESMSEETGSELNGRFTALQMAGEEIKNQMIASVVALNALVTSAGTGNSLLSDILTQHAITNAYLEDIVKYSKVAAGYGAKLDKIVEQTKNL